MSIPTVYAVPPNAGAFPVYRNIWNRSPQSVALQGYHIQSTSQYGYLLQEPMSPGTCLVMKTRKSEDFMGGQIPCLSTVSTPLVALPIAPTPLVTGHTAPTDISYPHVAPRSVPPCASSAPPPTLHTSHSNVNTSNTIASSRSHVARHVAHPHTTSRSERPGALPTPSSPPRNSPFNIDISHAARPSCLHGAETA
ncbi:hypothetical protein B0H14DRAFT_3509038 [Mycena olivaceomarginata]|nr:hypothetical protein B0H14DRAFT_3509038 [Mycena olivaceomarginata]